LVSRSILPRTCICTDGVPVGEETEAGLVGREGESERAITGATGN
jgi:hypothetical protein